MVTFAQLRDAQPERLAEAAHIWERRAKAVGRRAEEVQAEVLDMLKRWSGPASQAARAKLNKQVRELTEARTAMQQVSDILDEAGTVITSAKADLAGAVAYARGKGLTVEDDGSVSWLDWNPLEWAEDKAAADHAADLIGQALRRASEADADAAADLNVARLVGQDQAPLKALSMSDDPDVERAASRFDELLAEAGSFELNGNRDELQEIADIVENLSPAEREAFLTQLSDEDLKTWREYMRGTSDLLWNEDGLPHWEGLDLDTSLLSTLSAEGVTRLAGAWPDLQPTPPDGSQYQRPGGPFDYGGKSWRDVNQGSIGDCWALAVLAGQGRGDPDAYEAMVRQNPNGTVSVRLYDENGDPHWVTVTGDLPVEPDGTFAGVSGDADNESASSAENWPAYVEKALVQAYVDDNEGGDPHGGYDDIVLDYPERAVEYLTGHKAESVDVDDISTSDIGQRVNSSEAVVVSTEGSDDDVYVYENDSGKLVGNHAYFVKDVLPDGRVVLGNPWGTESSAPQIILTQDELREHGAAVTVRK